ncbi:MAG: 2-amino-4-hydroxy-6-hydroxymethyldihydropteridine diphosphokinase [Zetaproteobacteria bacterium]|nr:MAG: 2-amino-4-hydroxy-6-hydroxymethyldihydropteridine diphosphokinase [Zetaproteobacteria bacterium]
MRHALIALGGNLGDVRAHFAHARTLLRERAGMVSTVSPCYRTPPLGPAGQPDYLNAVLALETPLSAHGLLRLLLAIERELGRIRPAPRWSARTLDLDLLDWGRTIMRSRRLQLPHPRLHQRMFVLQPLYDIAPDWIHPRLHLSARQLRESLLARGEPRLDEGMAW